MPDFAVVTAFKATDRLSPVFNKMGRSADKFGRRGAMAMEKINRAQTAVLRKIKMFAGIGIGLAAGLITREFLNFDQAITAASAKFPELQKNTEESKQALQDLKMTARIVGRDTQFSAAQAAEGLDFLAMAGFTAKQSMSLLPGVTNLATVANVDLARATDIASDAIGAFGMMTTDTGQLTKNFTRINDVMAATMTRANTNMEDLFESIKKGAASFTAAGQSVESFNALAGIMANSGLKGAESGTQLRNIMLRLAAPTKAASIVLDRLNIRTRDARGNFRDVVDILEDFEKGTKDMGTAQRSAALATVFGARSVTGMNILLQEGTTNIRNFREGLIDAGGASKKMADVMRGSLINKLKALLSAVIELGFKFIDAFSAKGAGAIDKLTEVARDLGPVFKVIGQIFAKLLGYVPLLIKAFVGYKIALIAVAVVQKGMMIAGWIQYLIMMRSAIMKAITMTKAWAVAQKIVNFMLSANPIGIVIMAIAALGYAIYDLYNNWDQYVAAFNYGIQEWIMKWKGLKLIVLSVMELFGKASKKSVQIAALEYGIEQLKYEAMKKQQEQQQQTPKAPNEVEAMNKYQKWIGDLNIHNAPEGSTFTQKGSRGAPKINTAMIGAQ